MNNAYPTSTAALNRSATPPGYGGPAGVRATFGAGLFCIFYFHRTCGPAPTSFRAGCRCRSAGDGH